MKRLLKTLAAITLGFLIPSVALATTDSFTSSGTWTAPAGVTSVQVNAWAGGGGGYSLGVTQTGRGGGGGGYSGLNAGFVVIPGNVYVVSVGGLGVGGSATPTAGGDSMFSASSTLLAKGGSPGARLTIGAGGDAASGVGDVKHSGGSSANTGASGGGGGGGTTADGSVGGSASGCTPGNGGAGGAIGGGNGGKGATSTAVPAVAGSIPGGGGGGGNDTVGCSGGAGANGARGQVDITYTAPAAPIQTATQFLMGGDF